MPPFPLGTKKTYHYPSFRRELWVFSKVIKYLFGSIYGLFENIYESALKTPKIDFAGLQLIENQ